MTSNTIGRRIVVVGSTGSGKSTLAATLAERLHAPFVELDAIFWQPDWVESDDETFRGRVAEATAGHEWVVAGNYRRISSQLIWPRAETMIWLDYQLPLLLTRILVRSWRRWRSRELLWGTNRETFWKHLKLWNTEDSLLAWAVMNHRRRRRFYTAASRAPEWSHIAFVRHRSPRETERWLAETFAAVD
jgi:adenylate kinase family enzyme